VLIRLLKLALVIVLLAACVTDIVVLCRSTLYSGDEIFNLDAILTFFSKGDYTTSHFGGYPFDPVISSGVLATWPFGAVLLAGGDLFDARLACALLQLGGALALAFVMARRGGLQPLDAVLFAVALWASLRLVQNHDLRVINPGEVWGFLFLAAGVLLLPRHEHAAAFCWGLATWLSKIIYLPFGGALILATAFARTRRQDARSAKGAALTALVTLSLAFAAPLLLWTLLIWARYGIATVAAWTHAYVVFVVRHAVGISLGYAESGPFKGWRFEPGWGDQPSFLSHQSDVVVAIVVPLLSGVVAVPLWAAARGRARAAVTRRELPYVVALLAVIAVFAAWFFSGSDPTQWERHLLPAIYTSIAIAAYCTLDSARALDVGATTRQGAAIVACSTLALAVATHAAAEVARFRGQTSYARTCRGTNAMAPPCKQERATALIEQMTRDICNLADRPWDEACMKRDRALFLDRATALARERADDPETVYTAAYVAVFLEQWAYRDDRTFTADLGPRLCTLHNDLLWSYFERAGADVVAMKAACPAA